MKKITILLLLIIAQTAFGQSFSVFDVDASSFPKITAKFYAFDAAGNPIKNLNNADFEVWENGTQRHGIQVSCPPVQPPTALSSVLVMDVSGSMGWGPGTTINMELAKAAARAWVNALPLGNSECAISTFDHYNYINQDFTNDRSKLLNAITPLNPSGGTDYDAALISPVSSGLLVSNNGKYQRVIVMLTDGQANTPQIENIVSEANRQQCVIYTVTLGMACPQSLKDIATRTGGQAFENVTTVQEAEDIYRKILQTAQGANPCSIEWQSGVSCIAGLTNAEIKLLPQNLTDNISYNPPTSSVAKLEFNPTSLKFENPVPGVTTPPQTVTVTARNTDFTINNITTKIPVGFDIAPKNFPITLKAGQSMDFTVTYFPADSGYNHCKFDVDCVPCATKFYVSGGWKGKKPTIRTIKLIHPNGGEVFIAGFDTVITWEGISPDEAVTLSYRTDDNQPWVELVKDSVVGLSYRFKVPKIASKKYLARVTASAKTSSYCDNPDVEICGQIWMGCNLDVDTYRNGEAIRHCQTDEEWVDANSKKEGAWCYYNNDPANGEIYGKLYNWYAVNDPRGLAPDGWHVATDAEWTELENCLGGPSVAGGKLRSTGTLEGGDGLWNSPNTGATNEIGFSALPGAYRHNYGSYGSVGYLGYWWSATEFSATAWYRFQHCNSTNIYRFDDNKGDGFSVRCVRD